MVCVACSVPQKGFSLLKGGLVSRQPLTSLTPTRQLGLANPVKAPLLLGKTPVTWHIALGLTSHMFCIVNVFMLMPRL